MTPFMCLEQAIEPALLLLPPVMTSNEARVELLAIAGQESGLEFRAQKTSDPYTKGPARGLWQNERVAVLDVMTNHLTMEPAMILLNDRKVPHDPVLAHARLEFDDVLAAGFARLILWKDPKPLPTMGDVREAWKTYLRCWRPGKPRADDWQVHYEAAYQEVLAW